MCAGLILGVFPDEGANAEAAARPITPACSFPDGFEDGFADVTLANAHETAVDCIVYWRITTGLRVGVYDPTGWVNREQMASFIARFVEASGGALPSSPPDAFGDDNGRSHEQATNQLAAAGIVTGRTPTSFAPQDFVTRAQMATFIVRALENRLGEPLTSSSGTDHFVDDDGNVHEASINSAASLGITGGVGGGDFAPGDPVRRDQMGSFLARGLAELVARGAATIPAPPAKCSLDLEVESTDAGCKPCPYYSSISASNALCGPPPPSAPNHAVEGLTAAECDAGYGTVTIRMWFEGWELPPSDTYVGNDIVGSRLAYWDGHGPASGHGANLRWDLSRCHAWIERF